MASEASAPPDQNTDKHMKEKEVTVAESLTDGNISQVYEVKAKKDGIEMTVPLDDDKDIVRDSGGETLVVCAEPDKPDILASIEEISNETAEKQEMLNTNITNPSNLEVKNVIEVPGLVSSVSEEGFPIEKHDNLATEISKCGTSLQVLETKPVVDTKSTDEPPAVANISISKVTETETDKNSESFALTEPVKDAEKLQEKVIKPTASESESLPADIPFTTSIDSKSGMVEPDAVEIEKSPANQPMETPIEQVCDVPKINVSGSTGKHDGSLNGETTAAKIVSSQEEIVTLLAIESKSEAIEEDASSQVQDTENQVPDQESCLLLESVATPITEVEKIHMITERPNLVDTDNILAATNVHVSTVGKIEELVDGEDDPAVIKFAQFGERKSEKEELPSDVNKALSQTEVSSYSRECLVETSGGATAEVAPVAEEVDSGKPTEVHPTSDSMESINKVVVEEIKVSGDVPVTVETISSEVANNSTGSPAEQAVPEISSLVAGDEKAPKNVIDSIEAVTKKVIEGSVVEAVGKRLVEKKEESNEACEVADVVNTGNAEDGKMKEDEKKVATKEISSHEADVTIDVPDCKAGEGTTEQDIATKTGSHDIASKVSNPKKKTMISKVKHSLEKAKKVIFWRSPSSKTMSETKHEDKA